MRKVARMCQGAAIARKMAAPESKCRLFQISLRKSCLVSRRYTKTPPPGTTKAIKPFNITPRPRLAARIRAQSLVCFSSVSVARWNAQNAKHVVNVSITSGINMRVNKNIPTEVAIATPA